MTTSTLGFDTGLTSGRRMLGRPVLGALAAAAVLVALATRLLGGTGTAGATVLAGGLYVLAQGALSLAVEGRRRAVDRTAGALVVAAFLIALLPLVLVLSYTVGKGLERFGPYFLTHSMRGVGAADETGGAYHAIVATIQHVAIASAIAIPVGLLAAVYVVEYGRGRLAGAVRFLTDVMTGVPSIVAGLFIYAFWVLGLGQGFSGVAAGLSLAILMLPTVVRASEEMLRLVPMELREASFALGIPRWRTILSIVLPTALAGITTGVMLAIARVTGETAPLLLTVLGFDSINKNPFEGQQSGLPLFVFAEAGAPTRAAVDRAWAGALTLIVIVMVLNLVARFVAGRSAAKQRG